MLVDHMSDSLFFPVEFAKYNHLILIYKSNTNLSREKFCRINLPGQRQNFLAEVPQFPPRQEDGFRQRGFHPVSACTYGTTFAI